jgi:hypothetical protein
MPRVGAGCKGSCGEPVQARLWAFGVVAGRVPHVRCARPVSHAEPLLTVEPKQPLTFQPGAPFNEDFLAFANGLR